MKICHFKVGYMTKKAIEERILLLNARIQMIEQEIVHYDGLSWWRKRRVKHFHDMQEQNNLYRQREVLERKL